MKKVLFIIFTLLSFSIYSQNIFPVKLDGCKSSRFCIDCGDTKAGYDALKFKILEDDLSKSLDNGLEGEIMMQVLIDSKGHGCVVSHTDESNSPITLKIITELNNFQNWIPATTNNKEEKMTSIKILFIIKEGKIMSKIERVKIGN